MRHVAVITAAIVAIAAGAAVAQPGGSGSAAGSGSATGSGSAAAGSGSAAVGSGSGSAAVGTGSGSATGPVIVDLPPDVIAPEVFAAANPAEVRLGDKFTLFITVVFDEGETVNLVRPLDFGPAFEAVPGKEVTSDTKRTDGKIKREWQIQLQAWDLGELEVPPQPVTFNFNGQAAQVATKPVPIRVVGTLGDVIDDKQMRPSARPVVLLSRDWFYVILAAGIVGTIFLVIFAWKLRRRRRRTVLGTGWTTPRRLPRRLDPAAEEALRRLTELEQSGRLDDDAERTGAYRELSDIMRVYVGKRAGIVHHDRTTGEMMERLRRRPIAALAALLDDIQAWFEGCDLVKFAAYEATAAEAHTAVAGARELVLASVAMPAAAASVMLAEPGSTPEPAPSGAPPAGEDAAHG